MLYVGRLVAPENRNHIYLENFSIAEIFISCVKIKIKLQVYLVIYMASHGHIVR